MKSRQHRKTVQRQMRHWVAGASWRRICAYNRKLAASVADSYGAMLKGFIDIETVSALNSVMFTRFPYQDLVFDESTEILPLLQPRTTHYLKSLITKDHQ